VVGDLMLEGFGIESHDEGVEFVLLHNELRLLLHDCRHLVFETLLEEHGVLTPLLKACLVVKLVAHEPEVKELVHREDIGVLYLRIKRTSNCHGTVTFTIKSSSLQTDIFTGWVVKRVVSHW